MAYMPCIPLAVKLPAGGAVSGSTGRTGRTDPCAAQTLCPAADGGVQGTGGVPAAEHSRPGTDGAFAGAGHCPSPCRLYRRGAVGGDPWPGCGWSHPPGGHRRCGRRSGNGCLGFCVGRAGRRCGGKAAGAALSGAGAVSDRALLSRIRGLALGCTAAAGQTAGYAPADRPLRAGKLPDDPPQKHHRPFGRGRTSGAGAPCRMRPLCFAGAL